AVGAVQKQPEVRVGVRWRAGLREDVQMRREEHRRRPGTGAQLRQVGWLSRQGEMVDAKVDDLLLVHLLLLLLEPLPGPGDGLSVDGIVLELRLALLALDGVEAADDDRLRQLALAQPIEAPEPLPQGVQRGGLGDQRVEGEVGPDFYRL